MRSVCAAVLAFAAAACGQGDSDNVMAPQANALSAEQVDLALGPEIGNAGANGVDATNDMNASTSVETNTTADAAPADNNSAEQ